MESAQDKFADPSFNPSETVLDINGKDSIVNIDVNNMDNLLNDINSGMSDLLTDPDLPSTNRIGELKIVLNDRTLTFVKDGNVFRLPKPGDVVI